MSYYKKTGELGCSHCSNFEVTAVDQKANNNPLRVEVQMKTELWHCTHCPQNSTRHWNLRTHIKRIHAGIGLPVRRTSSRKQSEAHMNFAEYFERKQQNQAQYTPNNTIVDGRNNVADSDPFAIWDKNQEALDKVVEIKKHLSKHATQQEAHVTTKAYLDLYAQTQDCRVLDNGLAFARRVARFADSLQQLSFGITQHLPRATPYPIPFSPFEARSKSIDDLALLESKNTLIRSSGYDNWESPHQQLPSIYIIDASSLITNANT